MHLHYLTLNALTRFLQNLRISAKNGTKMDIFLQNSNKICIVPIKEIVKKVVANLLIRKKLLQAMNGTISILSA